MRTSNGLNFLLCSLEAEKWPQWRTYGLFLSSPSDSLQIESILNVGLHESRSPPTLHQAQCYKMTSALWDRSALTVVGRWSGEATRKREALAYPHQFSLLTDGLKENLWVLHLNPVFSNVRIHFPVSDDESISALGCIDLSAANDFLLLHSV